MLSQVYIALRCIEEENLPPLHNIVFMGMGEPLNNLVNVKKVPLPLFMPLLLLLLHSPEQFLLHTLQLSSFLLLLVFVSPPLALTLVVRLVKSSPIKTVSRWRKIA